MITVMWYEFVVWSIIMILLGFALWDMIWTVIVPDSRAANHFARASWKRNLTWTGVIALAIFAIIGWIY